MQRLCMDGRQGKTGGCALGRCILGKDCALMHGCKIALALRNTAPCREFAWMGGKIALRVSPAPGARAACAAPPCAAAARTPACARGCAAACAAPARPPAWPAGHRSCPAHRPHRASDGRRACLIMLLCSAIVLLHACLKWQHMSQPHGLHVPIPLTALHMAQVRRLAVGPRMHSSPDHLWKLCRQSASQQRSPVNSVGCGNVADLLPLPEAPLRLLISFCQNLAEGLARGCVGGGAAIAAIQRGALVPAAASAVRVLVAAALRRVARLCSSTGPASEEVDESDSLPFSLHRHVYLRCDSFRGATFWAETSERLQLR